MSLPPYDNIPTSKDVSITDPGFLKTLRFGDGTLLRDGTYGHCDGRTLKGRYIIRVGWDDVRGWMPQVSTALFFLALHRGKVEIFLLGWDFDRYREVQDLPYS